MLGACLGWGSGVPKKSVCRNEQEKSWGAGSEHMESEGAKPRAQE